MAGLVGNAPASAKKEINYLQTNNLEKLNRNKRNIKSENVYFSELNLNFNNSLSSDFKKYIINEKTYSIVFSIENLAGLYKIKEDTKEKIHNSIVNDFCLDNKNNIYIAAIDGLFKYDIYGQKTKISNIIIQKINIDSENNIIFYSKTSNYFKDKNYFYIVKHDEVIPQNINNEIMRFCIENFIVDWEKENLLVLTNEKMWKYSINSKTTNEIMFPNNFNINLIKTISIDNSDNIFFSYLQQLFFIKNNEFFQLLSINGNSIFGGGDEIPLLININKYFYLLKRHGAYEKYFYLFDRKEEWMNEKEKYVNKLEYEANRLKEEKINKERIWKLQNNSKELEKRWQIDKLTQLKNELETRKQKEVATPFEEKLLACLKENISTGFSFGFGVLGGFAGSAAGTALAPGGGTVAFGMTGAAIGNKIGDAIGKWIGTVIGDYIEANFPEGAKCSF